jgi:hypothetical protein
MYSLEEQRQIISACSKDEFFFGKIVAPRYFNQGFATFHRHMINEVNNRPSNCNLVVLEVPRGFAKSAIISTLNPLHKCVFKKVKYVIVASYSSGRANKIIGDYKQFVNGEQFRGIFPGTEIIKDREDLIEVKNVDLGFHFQIMARGRDSQVAGMRFEEARPQIFIGDDLEDPDESFNPDVVDKNVAFVDGVVQYGLDPDIGYSVLIGTPFAFDCITGRIGRRKAGVRKIIYPGLVDDNMIPGMSKKLGIPNGHSIWEERFSTECLLQKKNDAILNHNLDHFMRNVMLDPRPGDSIRIPTEKIHHIPVEALDELKRRKLNVYILADYAYSRQIWADESAIVVVGIDDESNHYILWSDKGKWGDVQTTSRIVDKVIEYKSQIRMVGVETRGLGWVERSIMDAKREHNLTFSLTELKPENKSKAERIKATIPLFQDGRVFMIGNQDKLEHELEAFRGEEMRRGDDLMDAWAYIKKVGQRPNTEKTQEEKDKAERHRVFEEWALKQPAYIREYAQRQVNRRVYHAGMRPSDF